MKKTFNGSSEDEVVMRPRMVKKYTTRLKTLILCSVNIKRKRPQRKTFGRNNQSSLIFHIGVNLRYDIV